MLIARIGGLSETLRSFCPHLNLYKGVVQRFLNFLSSMYWFGILRRLHTMLFMMLYTIMETFLSDIVTILNGLNFNK